MFFGSFVIRKLPEFRKIVAKVRSKYLKTDGGWKMPKRHSDCYNESASDDPGCFQAA
jgi:hypothetical protein